MIREVAGFYNTLTDQHSEMTKINLPDFTNKYLYQDKKLEVRSTILKKK